MKWLTSKMNCSGILAQLVSFCKSLSKRGESCSVAQPVCSLFRDSITSVLDFPIIHPSVKFWIKFHHVQDRKKENFNLYLLFNNHEVRVLPYIGFNLNPSLISKTSGSEDRFLPTASARFLKIERCQLQLPQSATLQLLAAATADCRPFSVHSTGMQ
jgi:hypothetical protein